MNIRFEKANLTYKEIILNFINGKKQYDFYGTTYHRVGFMNNKPFCFILSDILKKDQDLSEVQKEYFSKSGHTITLDLCKVNKEFLGKSLASNTLKSFIKFYHKSIDPLSDTFFIDPDGNNPRAMHVYNKAVFKQVREYIAQSGTFKGNTSYLMVKN